MFGPTLPPPPRTWVMPPPPVGCITKAETRAILPQEDIGDEVKPLTPEQIATDYATPDISDFTPYLGPTRVILLLLRRPQTARRGCLHDREASLHSAKSGTATMCSCRRHCPQLPPRHIKRRSHLSVPPVPWRKSRCFRCGPTLRNMANRKMD